MSVVGDIRCVSGRQPTGNRLLLSLLGAAMLLAGCVSPGSPPNAAPGSTASPDSPGQTASSASAPRNQTGSHDTTDAPDRESTTTPGPNATTSPDPNETLAHGPNTTDGSNVTVGSGDQPAALESRLYGLVTAENRTAYAAARGLRLRNGSVLVVVELRESATIPTEFDVRVRSRYENLVQAFVPVDSLVPVAEHGNVSFVRTPREAVTDSPSIDAPHPHPCSPRHPSGESSRSVSYCS